ncbi:MAG: hypothetical protein LC781_13815 [Actinobacteria bacterium]|nr:hypothetical protein [Actinomycetota bacterium]
MVNENEAQVLEESVARVTVSADAGFLPPVVDFVKQTAHRLSRTCLMLTSGITSPRTNTARPSTRPPLPRTCR